MSWWAHWRFDDCEAHAADHRDCSARGSRARTRHNRTIHAAFELPMFDSVIARARDLAFTI
jgi:hypothetical protein